MPIIEGSRPGYLQVTGAPSAGTDEVQTLTTSGTISSGTFKLAFDGFTTGDITWSATNNTLVANIDAALEALPNIGTGNVTTAVGTMTSGIGTITITFAGALAKKAVPTITVASKSLVGSGADVAVAETTPGVTATHRGQPTGALLMRDNGTLYVNTGTAYAPTWTAQV